MDELTQTEATVLRSLLAAEPVSETERVRRAEVPSRTFAYVRAVAYREGWVFDRYVPNPLSIGTGRASVVLAHPYAERFREAEQRLAEDPRTVLLWRWPEALLAVALWGPVGRPESEPFAGLRRLGRSFDLIANLSLAEAPVYFDFEASWSRLSGHPTLLAYPHSLPESLEPAPALTERERSLLTELIRRPLAGRSTGRSAPVFLPRPQRRLLQAGAASRRVFLNPVAVPPFRGRGIERLAFVHGRLLPSRSPASLFRSLIASKVTPFLFVTDGSKVLFGGVSPAPNPEPPEGTRPAVLGNLQRFLREIEISREPVPTLSAPLNHRYDRVLRPDVGAEEYSGPKLPESP